MLVLVYMVSIKCAFKETMLEIYRVNFWFYGFSMFRFSCNARQDKRACDIDIRWMASYLIGLAGENFNC